MAIVARSLSSDTVERSEQYVQGDEFVKFVEVFRFVKFGSVNTFMLLGPTQGQVELGPLKFSMALEVVESSEKLGSVMSFAQLEPTSRILLFRSVERLDKLRTSSKFMPFLPVDTLA